MPEHPSKELLQRSYTKAWKPPPALGESLGGLTTKDYFAKQEKIRIFANKNSSYQLFNLMADSITIQNNNIMPLVDDLR